MHRIWDAHIINEKNLSYPNYANSILYPIEINREIMVKGTYSDWAQEARDLLPIVYENTEKGNKLGH